MKKERFCVTVTSLIGGGQWPKWFDNFHKHCKDIADENGWNQYDVMNYQLRPHGILVSVDIQWELRWEHEHHHTMFLLKWS